jgi:hypothetical protein
MHFFICDPISSGTINSSPQKKFEAWQVRMWGRANLEPAQASRRRNKPVTFRIEGKLVYALFGH